jgi:Secretion system C-terminal sorting domain
MKHIVTKLTLLIMFLTLQLFAQQVGDFQTKASGNWSNATIWQIYNGSAWQNFNAPPTGGEKITVLSTDSVYVDIAVSISDTLLNQGVVEPMDSLTITIDDGGVYHHDRDGGTIPKCIWAEGSTILITGVTGTAPNDRDQDYYNVVFNTPDLLSNLNMNLNNNTISGDVHVMDTGPARWYLTSAQATETSTVTIMGDVIIDKGNFSVQGTGNAQTTFIVYHYGNINVTGGNFSISRGSQGGGTTTWYLYEGDFSLSNAVTQSSTSTQDGAKFIFAKQGTQSLTLTPGGDDYEIRTLPIEVSSGTTLDLGSTVLEGSGNVHVREGGNILTKLSGGVEDVLANVTGTDTLEVGSGYGFTGSEAQITSTRMPVEVGDLIIDNAAGVTLSQETTINGVLHLVAGVFDNTIPFTLGPSGSISYEGGSLLVGGTAIESDGQQIPEKFFINQNYPNPFNPLTTIKFGTPSLAPVSIKVFNMLGQQVATLFEGRLQAGEHKVQFDATDLSSGVYFYRIQAGNNIRMKQMILLK